MGKSEHGLAICHLSKPGLVQSFLTVGLECGQLLLREAI